MNTIQLTKWERSFLTDCVVSNIIDLNEQINDLSDHGKETLQLLTNLKAKLKA
jgi:hypothetical protein